MFRSSSYKRSRFGQQGKASQEKENLGKENNEEASFFQPRVEKKVASADAQAIQRLATPQEDEHLATNDERMKRDRELRMKPEDKPLANQEKEKEEIPVQKKEDSTSHVANKSLAKNIQNKIGHGQALQENVLNEMNKQFQVDFSAVIIHTDEESNQLCQAIHAQAFTVGKDIFFRAGKYNPNTVEGKQLLVHELTHVLQQQAISDLKIQ
jgi:hypothetical protein